MRWLLICLVVAGGAASALTEREILVGMLMTEMTSQGIPETMAMDMVPCFMDRLTDQQVTSLIEADDDTEREQIINAMADPEGAELCALLAMSQ
ncbi:hypothetical protein V8J82_10690 [Gymnodinialimonas sp. 2305UL16-5]|uniref:hypothetical protein n=1 Tax=Gymnodinialimonas mytili TaxID=3126503 RepID=UPI0030B793D6